MKRRGLTGTTRDRLSGLGTEQRAQRRRKTARCHPSCPQGLFKFVCCTEWQRETASPEHLSDPHGVSRRSELTKCRMYVPYFAVQSHEAFEPIDRQSTSSLHSHGSLSMISNTADQPVSPVSAASWMAAMTPYPLPVPTNASLYRMSGKIKNPQWSKP